MPLQLYNKIQRIPSKNGANSFSVSKTPTQPICLSSRKSICSSISISPLFKWNSKKTFRRGQRFSFHSSHFHEQKIPHFRFTACRILTLFCRTNQLESRSRETPTRNERQYNKSNSRSKQTMWAEYTVSSENHPDGTCAKSLREKKQYAY